MNSVAGAIVPKVSGAAGDAANAQSGVSHR